MINVLVWFARVFLIAQVMAAVGLLTLLALGMAARGQVTLWQLLGLAGGAAVLMATAGFTAILFQISDRLAELVAQGKMQARADGQIHGDASARPRREPTLGPAK